MRRPVRRGPPRFSCRGPCRTRNPLCTTGFRRTGGDGRLAGRTGRGRSRDGAGPAQRAAADWPEAQRLARLFHPAPATRPLYRTVVAALRMPGRTTTRKRWIPLLASLFAAPTGMARAVTALVWAGALVAWLGLTVTFVRAAGPAGPASRCRLPLLTSLALLATFVIAAGAATAAAYLVGLRMLPRRARRARALRPGTRRRAAGHGAAPGAWPPGWTGSPAFPDRTACPPWSRWLADRIDDLAGIPPRRRRRRWDAADRH